MTDQDFENLIRMAIESGDLDDPAAADPRQSACLSVRRLEAAGRAGLPLAQRERRHLSCCVLCRARFAAFAGMTTTASNGVPVGRGHRLRIWAVRGAAVAAAACLVVLLNVPRSGVPDPADTAVGALVSAEPHDPIAISVCHRPAAVAAGQPRVDCFPASSDQACIVLAVFRGWDDACQCLQWHLHEWDAAGRTLAELDADELLEIALNVTGNPPVGQLLVLATSRQGDDLPATVADADALLECLNDVAPPACADSDVAEYAAAVRECLPDSVTLVQQTFFVE